VAKALKALIEAVFKVLFAYECRGKEFLPSRGPAIVAANHPSYLDPLLLSLQVDRPIRFMAWDALFRIPILGGLIRAFGAFPVDVRRGKGRLAYDRAKGLVEAGEVVGLFPEGKRSSTGWMEESLREGAARLAWETGAPIVPATIAGAYRAWPSSRTLPTPAKIRVRFHEPIDPSPYQALPEEKALPALLAEIRARVDRSLLPGVKADRRISALYRGDAPWPRGHESIPPLLLALLVFWRTRTLLSVAPAYAYILYLLLDHFFLPQRRFLKRLRNVSPFLFLLAYGPVVLRVLSLPEVQAGVCLVAVMAGALFPYLYERGRVVLDFMRGIVIACLAELGALYLAPSALGPHVALALFVAAYAWGRKTLFSSYVVPILLAYVGLLAFWLYGGFSLITHAVAALVAWLLVTIFPYNLHSPDAPEEAPEEEALSLHLRE